MIDYKRVDPPDCGCTDCGNGDSRPLNVHDDEMLHALLHGHVSDATGGGWPGDVPDWINHLGQAGFGDLLVEEWIAGRLISHPIHAGVVATWRTPTCEVFDERVDGLYYPLGSVDVARARSRMYWETYYGPLVEVA